MTNGLIFLGEHTNRRQTRECFPTFCWFAPHRSKNHVGGQITNQNQQPKSGDLSLCRKWSLGGVFPFRAVLCNAKRIQIILTSLSSRARFGFARNQNNKRPRSYTTNLVICVILVDTEHDSMECHESYEKILHKRLFRIIGSPMVVPLAGVCILCENLICAECISSLFVIGEV